MKCKNKTTTIVENEEKIKDLKLSVRSDKELRDDALNMALSLVRFLVMIISLQRFSITELILRKRFILRLLSWQEN